MLKIIKIGFAVSFSFAVLVLESAQGQTPQPEPKKQDPYAPMPPTANIPASVTLIPDIEFGKGGGLPLYMHLAVPKNKPEKPVPVIVFIHGGGLFGGDRNANILSAYKFAENGYASATIEYRLADLVPLPAQIQDCKCAIRYLRANAAKYNIDPDHIGISGDSAGGYLVAMLGLTENVAEFEGDGGNPGVSSRVQAVCDFFGPSDLLAGLYSPDRKIPVDEDKGLPKLMGGPIFENLDKLRKMSPLAYVAGSVNTPPFLILHGSQDPNVRLQESLWLADALDKKGADVTLRIVLNEGHGGRFFFPKVFPEMLAFYNRTLKPNK